MILNLRKIKHNYERPFIDILDNLKAIQDNNDPNIIWWILNDEWYMYQNEKNSNLLCHYDRVWSILKSSNDMDCAEIQILIRNVMEKRFKLGYLTPNPSFLKRIL